MTRDGYPEPHELERIEKWPAEDGQALMAFVKSLWWAQDWGWAETPEAEKIHYSISTAGWSGNEELIGALRHNHIFWALCWESSERGGHHEFSVLAGKV